MCVCSFAGVVCLCGGLFICAPLCFFCGLVVCVCVCLLVFWHLGAHFGFVVALCGALWRLCGTLVTLGLHCGTLGLQLGTRGAHFGVFFALWGPFGRPWAPFEHPWAPFGHPWAPFWCPFNTLGRGPGPLWTLWGKRRDKCTKNNGKWDPWGEDFETFSVKISSGTLFHVFLEGLEPRSKNNQEI